MIKCHWQDASGSAIAKHFTENHCYLKSDWLPKARYKIDLTNISLRENASESI